MNVSANEKLKILITGASGFVGRHLLEFLTKKEQEFEIYVSTRHRTWPFEIQPSGMFFIQDLDLNTDWSEALTNIDIVIHLAGRAHQIHDQSDNPMKEFQRINTDGTANLVRQSISAKVKHFIFISSIGAVKSISRDRINENSYCEPDTTYGLSKLLAEEQLVKLSKTSAMKWTILRPSLIYGPNNPGNMERLISLIKSSLPLPLKAINNSRNLLYIQNLVSAIDKCIMNQNAYNQIFCICDDDDISTSQLIILMSKHLNSKTLSIPIPIPILLILGKLIGKDDAIMRLVGSLPIDNGRIKKKLDWVPPFTVEEGIKATCQTFSN